MDRQGDESDDEPTGGLLGGIGPWHIRVLTDHPWLGGMGHPVGEVANWTLDQVLFALGDRKLYRRRRKSVATLEAVSMTDEEGKIKARAKDGTPIRGRIVGKSKARQLMEAAKERKCGKRKKQR